MSGDDKPSDAPSLAAAYALQTPDDSRRLYRAWAGDYDASFAQARDYQLHLHVARAFHGAGGCGPVLDVGAGTGLCGVALAELGVWPVDGVDISPEMLEQARAKSVYRELRLANLYDGPPGPVGSYAGIVSSGTFTSGHVGPEVLPDLISCAAPGALVAISVKAEHYSSQGFAAVLDGLTGERIRAPKLHDVPIYGDQTQGDHKDDRAVIVLFQVM